ncbi:unnamed protein product, partial [Ectocarpus fasciculatus]
LLVVAVSHDRRPPLVLHRPRRGRRRRRHRGSVFQRNRPRTLLHEAHHAGLVIAAAASGGRQGRHRGELLLLDPTGHAELQRVEAGRGPHGRAPGRELDDDVVVGGERR